MNRLCNLLLVAIFTLLALPASAAEQNVLRVCADPNNLPWSNAAGEGFENRLAQLVADDMHARLEYTWWAQRRGFVRNTLKAGQCDLVMGVPAQYELTRNTQPYYRSGYVFVSRRERGLDVARLDDPRLAQLRIGVHLIGPDNLVPPAEALTRRGLAANLHGYSIYGDYREPNPPTRLLQAVLDGEVDVALAWGPLAGWYAREHPQLVVTPVQGEADGLPLQYAVAMGVRKDDSALQQNLNQLIARHQEQISALLASYGVPLLPAQASGTQSQVKRGGKQP